MRASDAIRIILVHEVESDLIAVTNCPHFVNAEEVLDLQSARLHTLLSPFRSARKIREVVYLPVHLYRAGLCGGLDLSRLSALGCHS